jgi:ribose-phosphate pyrophosphokinase
MLLYFDDEEPFARRLAAAAGLEPRLIARHRFPDGELKLTLPDRLAPRVVLLRSLHHPNEKLVELLLAAGTAHELGARELVLVAPYLGYMRQDSAFNPGEAVSQTIVGRHLATLFDTVITVDPHLHRTGELALAVPCRRPIAVAAAPLVAPLIAHRTEPPVFLGPDEEAAQWVGAAAADRYEWSVCRKVRTGDRRVEVTLPGVDVRGRPILLIDDIASTGQTLLRTVTGLWAAGAARIDVFVTHPVFVGDALHLLHAARVGDIWSSDTVPHPTNAVSIVPLLAEAIGTLGQ